MSNDQHIGPYRIVGVLGSGGMGDVLRAVRDDDQYHAEVAIKVMRADVRNARAEQRFRAERQILASLDHRNIARLLDGGTTAGGLPYVVMELVNGEPVDRFCESRNLSARDIVQLFMQVCAAVSFAHQNLVVHRDLKPGNIFVTADGSVKLLDFGIAKLLDDDTAEVNSDGTATQLRAMTLEYASPEQLSGGAVTTVSDVYSLGVVLYRLLTGQSPYRATGGDAARVAEILGDTTPTRPSATESRRSIDTDLDHILLMALRKEPAKRYGSVDQLAGDLRNYLHGDPVLARRGTLGYRSRKFVRRHRVPIVAAALVTLSLIAGTAFAIREARIADAERATAQRHFDSVRRLSTRLFDFHDEIEKLEGATKAREMLLTTSLEYLDALYQEQGQDRILQRELADAYRRMARIQGFPFGANTGDTQGSIKSYQRAAALTESLHAANPNDHTLAVMLAEIYTHQTFGQVFTAGSNNSLESARRAVKHAESVPPSALHPFERATLLGNAYYALSQALSMSGQGAEASQAAERMVGAAEEYAAAQPEDPRAFQMLSAAYSNIGQFVDPALPREAASEKAVSGYRKSIAALEKLVSLEPAIASHQWDLADVRFNLGKHLTENDQPALGLEQFDLATSAIEARARDGNDANATLIMLMNEIYRGRALFALDRLDQANARLDATIPKLVTLTERYDNLQVRFVLHVAQVSRAQVLAARSRPTEWRRARQLLQEGIEGLRKIDESASLSGDDRVPLDEAMAALERMDSGARRAQ